jgi:23S rRNA pseudouridine1911/1915/1917 synthase
MYQLPEIIFENDAFVVLNKPSGLLSVPDRLGKEVSLKQLLIQKYGNIFTVHRLDKDTSGIILFAKTEDAHSYFSQAFENRKIEKYYYGLVKGNLFNQEGAIDAAIAEHPYKLGEMTTHQKGKPSLTTFTVEKSFKHYDWVKFQLHTGRTHQIRVHCKYLGNSIVCDDIYGDGLPILLSSIKKKYNLSKKDEEEKPILGRLGLHAFELKFIFEEKEFHLIAPIPKDLRATLTQLEKNN